MSQITGTVKWFNPTKGYGFIKPDDADKDIFIHISAVERSGLTNLNEDQRVKYTATTRNGKDSVETVELIKD